MILETSWGTPTGWMIVRDVLLIGPWHHEDDRSRTYRRTPNDYEAEHILLRTIRCVSGEVQTIMDCEPVLDYGQAPVRWDYTGDGYHQGARRGRRAPTSTLTLTTDMRLGFEGGQASARTLLKEGDTRFVALSWGGAVPPRRPTTTPTRGWCGRRTTGSTGWPAARSPTTRGAATCSAAP